MLKLNKKGFALVETLIVSVFVATIFTIMYTNFFPMFGEYERRETYDDVDSIYRTYLLKKMFENSSFKAGKETIYTNYLSKLNNNQYSYIELASIDYTISNEEISSRDNQITVACSKLTNSNQNYCVNVLQQTKVAGIYLTTYNITNLKSQVKNGEISSDEMDVQMQDYIDTLPYYTKNSSGCNYRIIVMYAKELNKESENHKEIIYGFSTIGVKL